MRALHRNGDGDGIKRVGGADPDFLPSPVAPMVAGVAPPDGGTGAGSAITVRGLYLVKSATSPGNGRARSRPTQVKGQRRVDVRTPHAIPPGPLLPTCPCCYFHDDTSCRQLASDFLFRP
jgi:hypothetical protein